MKENIGLSIIMLTGCAIIAMFLASRSPVSQAACIPMPMPTGEQIYPADFILPPPSSVYVGQNIRIEFTGGMLVAPTGQQCGDDFSILLPNQATAEATIREVQVRLDDQIVHAHSCGYHCILEFYVPSYFPGGPHEWRLRGVWDGESFPVYVQPLALT